MFKGTKWIWRDFGAPEWLWPPSAPSPSFPPTGQFKEGPGHVTSKNLWNHVNAYTFGPGPRWWRDLSILKQQQAPVDRKRHVSIDIQLKFNEWKIMMYSIVKCPFHDIVWFGLASWLWWKIWECWWPPSLRPILGWWGQHQAGHSCLRHSDLQQSATTIRQNPENRCDKDTSHYWWLMVKPTIYHLLLVPLTMYIP